MVERVQRKSSQVQTSDDSIDEASGPQNDSGERLKGELDDLLDEIDAVLESNAEDFIRGYVQKGGQ